MLGRNLFKIFYLYNNYCNGTGPFINFINCTILDVCNFSNYAYSQELRPFHDNVYSDYKNNKVGVNDTFTITGSLVSTIDPFLVQDNEQYKTNYEQNSTIGLDQTSENIGGNMSLLRL